MITIKPVTGAELYRRYPGQTQRQDCFVSLDAASGDLGAGYNPEIGNAVPARVFHGHVRRWRIPPLKAQAANALLEKISPLAERVTAGYEKVWDGHNHVGRYTKDATAAADAIHELCERADDDGEGQVVAYAADEWFAGLGDEEDQARELGIAAGTTDAQLESIAARELENAQGEADIVEGIAEYLRWLRGQMRDALRQYVANRGTNGLR